MTSEGHHLTPQIEQTVMFTFQIALEELCSETQVTPKGRGPCSNTRVLDASWLLGEGEEKKVFEEIAYGWVPILRSY